ncbi:MAG: hypothetical protein DI563_27230 [Variovorax paradoxus]|uniref:Uncharacterized protein n=1 Tax=Variovorax paradoxus TaxID=34073 RepID=A0A2W5R0U1_VARPD|nr:MAG: hypothetical protein DI563_27230 [Variovorax paradoxus]
MSPEKKEAADAQASLEQTIDKAKEVAAEIRQAADNLAVVNTVLEEKLPDHVQVGEVAQALDQSVEVEKQLSESVDRLQQVHDELGQSAGGAPPAKKG